MDQKHLLDRINVEIKNLVPYHLVAEDMQIKLNQNENPYDWPFELKQKIIDRFIIRPWNRYPDFIPQELNKLLAHYNGVTSDMIISGNGSNEMLLTLFLSLSNPQTDVLIPQPTFTVYQLLARGLGRQVKSVGLNNDLTFDTKKICTLSQQSSQPVLILCSPNNPTGNSISEQELCYLLNNHDGFVILDQAYVEFGGFNALPLLKKYAQLIITRTFSKALAGASLRLGYMIGNPEILQQINKIKLPYNINFFTQTSAIELLTNRTFIDTCRTKIVTQRNRVFHTLKALPLQDVYQSDANFILIRTEKKNTLYSFLKEKDVFIRDVSSYPMLKDCLRISIGTEEENETLMDLLKQFFQTT